MKNVLSLLVLASLPLATGCGPTATSGGGGDEASGSCSARIPLRVSWEGPPGTLASSCPSDFEPGPAEQAFDAVVTQVDGGTITLDGCAPGANCTPALYTLHLDAMGLAPPIPVGTFVHASFTTNDYLVCPRSVRLTNLDSWGGTTNPTTTAPLVWLDVSTAKSKETSTSGPSWGLEPIAVSCDKGVTVYDYRFYDPEDPENAVVVPVGQIGTLNVQRNGQPELWMFGNARAGCGLSGCEIEDAPFDSWVTQAPGG